MDHEMHGFSVDADANKVITNDLTDKGITGLHKEQPGVDQSLNSLLAVRSGSGVSDSKTTAITNPGGDLAYDMRETSGKIFVLQLKCGKAFLDHLTDEDHPSVSAKELFADTELCVHLSFGTTGCVSRKYAKSLAIDGPEPVWNEIFQFHVPTFSNDPYKPHSGDAFSRGNYAAGADPKQPETLNLHAVFYRHNRATNSVDVISSQRLDVTEGAKVYELFGVEKK